MPNKGTDNAATGNTSNPSGSTQVTWGLRSKTNTVSLGPTTHIVNMPPDVQRGDAIILIVATKNRSEVSAPAGFTAIKSVDKKLHAFIKTATASENMTAVIATSASTKLLATALSYYGITTQSTVYFGFNDSNLVRAQTPMSSVEQTYKNGLLIYSIVTEEYTDWSGWTNNAKEIADFAHGIDLLTLAIAEGESTTNGASSLVEATASKPGRSVSLTMSFNSTGIETYILGNQYTSSNDNSFTIIPSLKYAGTIFPAITYNSWIYRIGYYGGRTTSTSCETVGSIYSVSSSKPANMLGRTYPIIANSGTKSGASGGASFLSTVRKNSEDTEILGVPLASDSKYLLAVSANDASFTLNMQGSGVSGDLALYTGVASNGYPAGNIANATKSSNKGHTTIWAWAETNVPPEAPKLISPNIDNNEISTTPRFVGEFRDCNGYYGSQTGTGVDRGDYITKYRVKIRPYSVYMPGITNGTFETNADGWINQQLSTGLTATYERNTTVKKTGTASLKVDVTGNTSGTANTFVSIDHNITFNVSSGTKYILTWNGLSKSTAMVPNMRLVWLNDIDQTISTTTASWDSITIDQWYAKTIEQIAPINAVKLKVQIYAQILNTSSQASVYYDDIIFDKWNYSDETVSSVTEEEKIYNVFYYTPTKNLENNSHYEWSAQTADAFGEWGAWSDWKDFWVALAGPVVAMYPTEAVPYSATVPSYYQYSTQPNFMYRWQSGTGSKMYKYDFELSTYPDFRDDDPLKQTYHNQTFSSLLYTSTLNESVSAANQTEITINTINNFVFDGNIYGTDKEAILVAKVQNEFMLIAGYNSSTKKLTVDRGYFSTTPQTYTSGTAINIYKFNLKEAWTPDNQITHNVEYNQLGINLLPGQFTTAESSLSGIIEEVKYFWRVRGYDTDNVPSPWSEGDTQAVSNAAANFLEGAFTNVPAVYAVNATDIDKLRSTSHRFKMYFCVWDTWKFSTTYPKLSWIKGSDLRDPEDYTETKFKNGDADYEIRFPANQDTPSDVINANIQETGFAILGDFEDEDFDCVVNIGPNRMAFVGEYISFDAKRSWTRGKNVGLGWDETKFTWTFTNASIVSNSFSIPILSGNYTGDGPFLVKWNTPGLYTIKCSYDGQPAVERKVRVFQDRNTTHYDVTEVGAITGGPQSGWSTSVTIKPSMGNVQYSRLDDIQEYQSVGLFIEEEWEINGKWVRSPLSFYKGDKTCLITGYIQSGSIRIDANTHTFSFTISPVSEQLKVVTMFGTQTWSEKYYKNVALVATPGLINQGSTLQLKAMKIIDVVLHLLQKWTNVLTRHDFVAWYDTSLQTRDTISTNEGPIWSSLSQLAEAEYAWLYTDQGNGICFEPNPSLRSWGAFGDLHPVPYIMDSRDIWSVDIEQKLMNVVSYCQVTGTRPYYPNSVFEGKYPSSIPEGKLGQWLVKTGQMFSSQWFADYMAENFYWDANRKITGTINLGMNRRIDVPGRIYLTAEIPERDLYFDAKEFYVVGGTYNVFPAEGKFTSSYQIIENMYKSTGITGVRLNVNADGYIKGTQNSVQASAVILTSTGNVVTNTNLTENVSPGNRNVFLVSSVDVYPQSLLKINDELMLVESINENVATVTRGVFSTAAESHSGTDLVTCIVYFKDNQVVLNASGLIQSVVSDCYTSAYIIISHSNDLLTSTEIVYGPDQIFVNGQIAIRVAKVYVSVANNTKDLEATGWIYILNEKDLNTTAVIQTAKTKTVYTDAIIS